MFANVNYIFFASYYKSDRLCRCGGVFMFSRCNKEEKNQISNKTLSVKHWLSCSLCYDNWKRWSIEKPNVKSDNWALIVSLTRKYQDWLNNIEIVPRKKMISHINLSKFQVLFLQKLHLAEKIVPWQKLHVRLFHNYKCWDNDV